MNTQTKDSTPEQIPPQKPVTDSGSPDDAEHRIAIFKERLRQCLERDPNVVLYGEVPCPSLD